jgi:hypothetical protein
VVVMRVHEVVALAATDHRRIDDERKRPRDHEAAEER